MKYKNVREFFEAVKPKHLNDGTPCYTLEQVSRCVEEEWRDVLDKAFELKVEFITHPNNHGSNFFSQSAVEVLFEYYKKSVLINNRKYVRFWHPQIPKF